jgi:hypothetical protein
MSCVGITRSIQVRAIERRSARNLCQRFGGDEPDASRLWVGHAYERDVRLRFSNGERTDALAVDREAVVQRAVRRVADARDRLAEEAVHQVFQVTRQRLGVSALALGDLQIPAAPTMSSRSTARMNAEMVPARGGASERVGGLFLLGSSRGRARRRQESGRRSVWASTTDSSTLVNDMVATLRPPQCCASGVPCGVSIMPEAREAQFNLGEFVVELLHMAARPS